jgi:hypothetical protein
MENARSAFLTFQPFLLNVPKGNSGAGGKKKRKTIVRPSTRCERIE